MAQVIEFYKPGPRSAPATATNLPEVVEAISAGDLLRELLERADTIGDVLILMTDKDGQSGVVSNLDGLADNLLFLKQFELRMLQPPEPSNTPRKA